MLGRIAGRITAITAAFFIAAAGVPVYAADPGAGNVRYQYVTDYGNGFRYTKTGYYNPTFGYEVSYQAETTPGESIKPIVLAGETVYGKYDIEDCVEYAQSLGYNVLGAMNTDFFSLETGVPLGIVVENGKYMSSPEDKPIVSFNEYGNAEVIEWPKIDITLENHDADHNEITQLTHFNKYRNDYGGLYLMDNHFSTVSTRTYTPGWFTKFKILEGEMKVQGTMELEVVENISTSDAQYIGDGYMILTASEESGYDDVFHSFDVGDKVTLYIDCHGNEALINAKWATGGGDIVLKGGEITNTGNWDRAITGVNPRSAIGIKEDGAVVYYTVDGRQRYSAGISMYQLAAELKAQGCVDAVNFDGGGSTAFAMRLPGSYSTDVINSPSDGSLRGCATYVLFVSEEQPDGVPLRLNYDSAKYVYCGSTLDLNVFLPDSVWDKGYMPADTPKDLYSLTEPSYGTFTEDSYVAGSEPGTEWLRMHSASTGAEGVLTLEVTDHLSDIAVYFDEARTENLMRVQRGQRIHVRPEGMLNGGVVNIDKSEFSYSVTEGFATITRDGLLIISDDADGTGYLVISSGGVEKTITLSVPAVFDDIDGHWAEDYITDLYDEGIVAGETDEIFGPEHNIRRGDFMLVLYRASGEPEVHDAGISFTDVSPLAYYSRAVAWAKLNGIAMGYGEEFRPQESMSRQQAFTFLYRYLKMTVNITDGTSAALRNYMDSDRIADYAQIAIATLSGHSIVRGSYGMINPEKYLTRAEMSSMFWAARSYMGNFN